MAYRRNFRRGRRRLGGGLRRKLVQKSALHRHVTRSRGISGRQKRALHRVIKRRR
jgi:hypothetical protein